MPKFRVTYRAIVSARVSGTIEADTEAEARQQVAAGEPLQDEETDVEQIEGPTSMDFDCEEISA